MWETKDLGTFLIRSDQCYPVRDINATYSVHHGDAHDAHHGLYPRMFPPFSPFGWEQSFYDGCPASVWVLGEKLSHGFDASAWGRPLTRWISRPSVAGQSVPDVVLFDACVVGMFFGFRGRRTRLLHPEAFLFGM